MPVSACLSHLYVLCSSGASLLAWQSVVMKMLSVQVDHCKVEDLLCSRHNFRAGNDVRTQYTCGRGTPHTRAAAGRTLCCRSSSCLDLINRVEDVISHCQPVVEAD